MTKNQKPSRADAEQAVKTLLKWAGDDPNRMGLKDTPKRVVEAFSEYFIGYTQDDKAELSRTFEGHYGILCPHYHSGYSL